MIFSIILYSIPSVFIMLSDVLMRKKTKQAIRVTSVIAMAYLFFISAFRNNVAPYHVGTDSDHFRSNYLLINSGYNTYTEWFYNIINKFLGSVLYLPPTSLFVVASLLICLCYYRFITRVLPYQFVLLGLFLFINGGIYFVQMNLMRQYMATAFFILALLVLIGDYLKDSESINDFKTKKVLFPKRERFSPVPTQVIAEKTHQKPQMHIIRCGILLLLSFLTHSIAITYAVVALLIFLCRNIKLNTLKKVLWVVFGFSIVYMFIDARTLLPYIVNWIPERLVYYMNSYYFTQTNSGAIVKQLVPSVILAYLLIREPKYQNANVGKDKILLLGFALYVILTNMFAGMIAFVRIGYLFDMFLCVVPLLCAVRTKWKSTNQIIKFALYTYYSVLTIVTIYGFGGPGVMPYNFVF